MTTLQQHVKPPTQMAGPTGSKASVRSRSAGYALGALRIVIGWTFLWAFFDKLLALGFSTGRNAETGAVSRFGADAWIHGGSPTEGFLAFAAKGPFQGFYNGIAGDAWTNWAFMLGLLAIGVTFTFGISMRLGVLAGAIMYLTMWSVVLAPDNNPITDDHTIGLLAVIVLGALGAGHYLGLGSRWERLPIVQRFPILK